MKILGILLAIMFLLLSIPIMQSLHEKLEKSCNNTGGSYLGGHCVHFNSR